MAVAALLLAPLAAASCAGSAPGSDVTRAELLSQIESGTAPTIVDVRSRREYEAGHVPGALHVPFWAAFRRAGELDVSRGGPVVLYCEHGPRAWLAKAAFRGAGFEHVGYLEGHMSGWKKAGLPQERPGEGG